MKYIFINPVTQEMYDKKQLYSFLKQHNFEQIYCEDNWLSFVKNEYKKTVLSFPESTIIDMRCPKAVQYVKQKSATKKLYFPSIEPILIHCAKELAEKHAAENSIIIATPCKSLADYGNSLQINNTSFISWNDFARKIGCNLKKTHLESSPIPPGCFGEIKNNISLTGEDEIKSFFESDDYQNAQIIEMFFCKYGCNNGDGVL